MMECPACGAVVPLSVRLCPACGRTVNPEAAVGSLSVAQARETAAGRRSHAHSGLQGSGNSPVPSLSSNEPATDRAEPSRIERERIVPEARRLMERRLRVRRLTEEILSAPDLSETEDGWLIVGYVSGDGIPGGRRCAALWRDRERRIRFLAK